MERVNESEECLATNVCTYTAYYWKRYGISVHTEIFSISALYSNAKQHSEQNESNFYISTQSSLCVCECVVPSFPCWLFLTLAHIFFSILLSRLSPACLGLDIHGAIRSAFVRFWYCYLTCTVMFNGCHASTVAVALCFFFAFLELGKNIPIGID